MAVGYRMLLMLLMLASLVGLVLLYGHSQKKAGILEERTTQQAANIEWRKQFDSLKAESAERVAKSEAKLHEARRQTDAKIAELQARDESIRAWMATRLPVALADIVWLSDAGPISSLPGGPVVATGLDLTASSYRVSHER